MQEALILYQNRTTFLEDRLAVLETKYEMKGETDDFTQYTDCGLQANVDISALGLTRTPTILPVVVEWKVIG
jgi:hypothetical protein